MLLHVLFGQRSDGTPEALLVADEITYSQNQVSFEEEVLEMKVAHRSEFVSFALVLVQVDQKAIEEKLTPVVGVVQ